MTNADTSLILRCDVTFIKNKIFIGLIIYNTFSPGLNIHIRLYMGLSKINYFILTAGCLLCDFTYNYYSCVFRKRNYRVLIRVCVCVSVFVCVLCVFAR